MGRRGHRPRVQPTSQGPSKFRFREELKPALEPGAIEGDEIEARRSESLAETNAYGAPGRAVKRPTRGPSVVWCAGCGKPILGVPGDRCEVCSAPPPIHWAPERQPVETTTPSLAERPLHAQPRETLSRMGPTWEPPTHSR
jgi:hypothetical protein